MFVPPIVLFPYIAQQEEISVNKQIEAITDDIAELHNRLAREIQSRKILEDKLKEVRDAAFISLDYSWAITALGMKKQDHSIAVSTVLRKVLKHLKIDIVSHRKEEYLEVKLPPTLLQRLRAVFGCKRHE